MLNENNILRLGVNSNKIISLCCYNVNLHLYDFIFFGIVVYLLKKPQLVN